MMGDKGMVIEDDGMVFVRGMAGERMSRFMRVRIVVSWVVLLGEGFLVVQYIWCVGEQ